MKKLVVSLMALTVLAIGAPSFSANAFTNALNKTSNALNYVSALDINDCYYDDSGFGA